MDVASHCTMWVGGEWFGLATESVYEVLGECVVEAVPQAPRFVAGVVPYRGEVLMVLCFRTLLGMEIRDGSVSVVVLEDEGEGELFGLAVDSMGELLSLQGYAGEELAGDTGAYWREIFTGQFEVKGRVMTSLKPERLWPMRLLDIFGNGPGGRFESSHRR